MEFSDLTNKTIKTIHRRSHSKYDDDCYLDIEFTDGTTICIVGGYEELWSGESYREYPKKIYLKEFGYEDPSDKEEWWEGWIKKGPKA